MIAAVLFITWNEGSENGEAKRRKRGDGFSTVIIADMLFNQDRKHRKPCSQTKYMAG